MKRNTKIIFGIVGTIIFFVILGIIAFTRKTTGSYWIFFGPLIGMSIIAIIILIVYLVKNRENYEEEEEKESDEIKSKINPKEAEALAKLYLKENQTDYFKEEILSGVAPGGIDREKIFWIQGKTEYKRYYFIAINMDNTTLKNTCLIKELLPIDSKLFNSIINSTSENPSKTEEETEVQTGVDDVGQPTQTVIKRRMSKKELEKKEEEKKTSQDESFGEVPNS